MIEKILLVLERLRAANVLQQEVCERRCNHIAVFRGQLDFWLRTIVDNEHVLIVAIRQ